MWRKPIFEPIASPERALMSAKESVRLSRFWRRMRINTSAHSSESLSLFSPASSRKTEASRFSSQLGHDRHPGVRSSVLCDW